MKALVIGNTVDVVRSNVELWTRVAGNPEDEIKKFK